MKTNQNPENILCYTIRAHMTNAFGMKNVDVRFFDSSCTEVTANTADGEEIEFSFGAESIKSFDAFGLPDYPFQMMKTAADTGYTAENLEYNVSSGTWTAELRNDNGTQAGTISTANGRNVRVADSDIKISMGIRIDGSKIYYMPDLGPCGSGWDAFFGAEDPVCVGYETIERMAYECEYESTAALLEQMHEADEDEINEYGVSDSDEH